MWSDLTKIGGVTNSVTLPNDGIVSVIIPSGVELCAYINGSEAPMHHLHVKAGDNLYFKLNSHSDIPANVQVSYDNAMHNLAVIPELTSKQGVIMEDNAVVHHHKHKHTYVHSKGKDDMSPAETVNLFANPGMGGGMGAGAGAGLGAGLLGGILGGALLGNNRNGLLGGGGGTDVVGGFVTPTQLQTGLTGVTDILQNTTVMQTLGDIKGAIPLAEGQVQLALSGAQNDINAQINTAATQLLMGQAGLARDVATTTAQIIASENATQDVVQNGNAAIQASLTNIATQGLQNTYALNTAIRDDGDKTRALIVSQNDAMLNRQLAVAEAALLEQRAIGRSRDVEVNVTQQVTQNQAQLQAQQQQQQQLVILSQVAAALNGLQNAVATNSNLIVGNTGAVATGTQTANPVNVRT